jgi:PAS domain S-box-containing protein
MYSFEQYKQTYKELVDIKYALDTSSIVLIIDAAGKISYVNQNFCKLTNYDHSTIIGKSFEVLFSDDMTEFSYAELKAMTVQGLDWQGEIHIKGKDNASFTLFSSVIPILNELGQPYQYITISQNITKQKQHERELKRNHQLFIEGPIIVFKWNMKADWPIEYVSENISQFGYTPAEFTNGDRSYYSIIHEDDRERIADEVKAYCESDVDCFEQEYRIIKNDNDIIWVYDFTRIVRDNKGEVTHFDGYLLDISERKQSETLLQKSDKLSLVGELAAGVAHEIRNPLTSIKGFTQILKPDVSSEKKVYVDIILDEIERIQYILSEFMNLAKPQSKNFQRSRVTKLITDVISLMNSEAILNRVSIDTTFESNDLYVTCDENQLKQVFVNFIKNAIDSMPNGGRLTIDAVQCSNSIVISFTDEGEGIPEDLLLKLGKPFFTTKEDGNGLGLMVSFKIIDQHSGKIEVESEVNKGTCFTITLPQTS